MQDIHYDLMDDGIEAYYYRNIYVERNIQEIGILYPNRLYQYTKKDMADEFEFEMTCTTKFNSQFNKV